MLNAKKYDSKSEWFSFDGFKNLFFNKTERELYLDYNSKDCEFCCF
jgi:hypothetical protein